MAYKPETIELCKQMYCIDGKSPEQIHALMHIPLRTIYHWQKKGNWDMQLRCGNIELSLKLDAKIIDIINRAIEDDSLGEPIVADKLSKLQKLSEKLRPERQLLGNIYMFVEASTSLIIATNDTILIEKWQALVPDLAEHLRRKFSKE